MFSLFPFNLSIKCAQVSGFSLLLGALLLSGSALAHTLEKSDVLNFEQAPFKHGDVYCDSKPKITPSQHSFELVDYVIMSSEYGERHALLTLHNSSSGQRMFSHHHVVAIYGDCSRKKPYEFEYKLAGNETLTKQISFGPSRFPIVKIIVSE